MLITRRSMITGEEHTKDLPVTQDQLVAYEQGLLAQHAFPDLTPAQREFVISGTTEEEWAEFVEGQDDEGAEEE